MAELNFDATTVDTEPDVFNPIPVSWQPIMLTESEWQNAKDGSQMLKTRFDVLDGEYQGRVIYKYFCLFHSNEIAKKNGEKHLGMLCKATGELRPSDTSLLHDKPVMGYIKVTKDTGYGPGNDVVNFLSYEDYRRDVLKETAPAPAPQQQQQNQQPPAQQPQPSEYPQQQENGNAPWNNMG